MSEKKSAAPIRLSSRTAVALRKSAGKTRLVCLAFGVVMTAGLFALAVFLGLRWLPAVPIVVAFTAFLDVVLYVHAERVTLSLTSLALSAEQASRALREGAKEELRKKTREEDEAEIRKDMERRLSSAEEPEGRAPEQSLSATRVVSRETKETNAETKTPTRRMRPVPEPEPPRAPQETAESAPGVRRRRRNPKPGLTLIEGSKKG